MQDPAPEPKRSLRGDRAKSQTLTPPQRTILDAILFFIRKGEIPTVREVGTIAGLRSPATVLKHLRALAKRKIITLSGKSRGIRLTSQEALDIALQSGAKASKRPRAKPRRGFSFTALPISPFSSPAPGIPLVGRIAAGKPIESYSEAFLPDGVDQDGFYRGPTDPSQRASSSSRAPMLPLDPGLFGVSGELMALRVEGDSMINAGILDGDYVIIRRQSTVEEGEIAAVIVNGEGTLKRWRSRSPETETRSRSRSPETGSAGKKHGKRTVILVPANERFDPIEISEEDGKDVLVFGKYVGLVRGNLQITS